MGRCKDNCVTVQQNKQTGQMYIYLPQRIVNYNKIRKGFLIKFSKGYCFPHIEKIIDPVNGDEKILLYRRE